MSLIAIVLIFQFQYIPVARRKLWINCPPRNDQQILPEQKGLFFFPQVFICKICKKDRTH